MCDFARSLTVEGPIGEGQSFNGWVESMNGVYAFGDSEDEVLDNLMNGIRENLSAHLEHSGCSTETIHRVLGPDSQPAACWDEPTQSFVVFDRRAVDSWISSTEEQQGSDNIRFSSLVARFCVDQQEFEDYVKRAPEQAQFSNMELSAGILALLNPEVYSQPVPFTEAHLYRIRALEIPTHEEFFNMSVSQQGEFLSNCKTDRSILLFHLRQLAGQSVE